MGTGIAGQALPHVRTPGRVRVALCQIGAAKKKSGASPFLRDCPAARGNDLAATVNSALTPIVVYCTLPWPLAYPGHDVLDLVRAIRNIFEHWFDVRDRHLEHDPGAAPDAAALAVQALTGWGEAEMRRGLGSVDAREMRAAAVARYFLGPGRFAELLLVFEFSKAWGSG